MSLRPPHAPVCSCAKASEVQVTRGILIIIQVLPLMKVMVGRIKANVASFLDTLVVLRDFFPYHAFPSPRYHKLSYSHFLPPPFLFVCFRRNYHLPSPPYLFWWRSMQHERNEGLLFFSLQLSRILCLPPQPTHHWCPAPLTSPVRYRISLHWTLSFFFFFLLLIVHDISSRERRRVIYLSIRVTSARTVQ